MVFRYKSYNSLQQQQQPKQQPQQQQQQPQKHLQFPDRPMGHMEDLIDECGGFGKFQALIIFGICIHKLAVGWSMMQMSYAGFVPDWYCETGPESDYTSFYVNETTKNISTLNKCSLNISDSTWQQRIVNCLEHRFEESARVTIITEWDIVCDRKWIKATITSIQMAGVLVGSILAGQLADAIGRKNTLFGFVLCHSLLNFGAAFSTSWEMFAGFRFALGVGAGAVMVISIPYAMEFLPTKWRPIIAVIPMMATGISLFALAAYLNADWRFLHIACGACGLPFVVFYFVVPEGVRWLTLQGRNKEAEKVIAKMAWINGRPFPNKTGIVLKAINDEEQASSAAHDKKYTYWDLFRSRHLTKLTLTFCFLWFTSAMVFYGISFGAASLAGTLELNIFLIHIIDQPSIISTFYLNNRFGRKKTCLGLYSISLLGSIGCFLAQFLVSEESRGHWIIGFSLLAKMGLGAAFTAVNVWSTELYPTVVRSVGSGILHSSAKLGGIAAPFVMDLDSHPAVAYASTAAMFVVAILVCLVIPESMGRHLTDSIVVLVPPENDDKVEVVVTSDDHCFQAPKVEKVQSIHSISQNATPDGGSHEAPCC